MNRILLLTALLPLAATPCPLPGEPAPDPVAMHERVHREKLVALHKVAREQRDELGREYLEGLGAYEKRAKEAGNLEGVLAARNERTRFASEQTLAEKDVSRARPSWRRVSGPRSSG